MLRQVSSEDRAKLVDAFNEEATEQVLDLYKAIVAEPQKKPKDHATVKTSFTSDRTVRFQIHQDIRRIFASKIESSTDKDGMLILTAAFPNNRGSNWGNNQSQSQGGKQQRRAKMSWQDRGGEYLHFSLYKENKDTMEVISFMSKQLKSQARTFQFAGTKDRRAVTVQRVSAHRFEAERLAGMNRMLRNAAVGDFEYQHSGLELGDLKGNEFVITLRDCYFPETNGMTTVEKVQHAQSVLSQAVADLHTKGYLNYYGLQRFGTFSTRTDTIGTKMLQSDFEAACNLLLWYSPEALSAAQNPDGEDVIGQDDKARALAIYLWKTTGTLNEALDKLPRRFSAESQIIRHLNRSSTDFLGALMGIQRHLKLMYVHAYQSRVWNLAASERWKLYGGKVVEGDLVLVNEHKGKEPPATGPEEVDAVGEVVIQAGEDDRANTGDDIFERARALTAEDAASGAYSIFDVVLPMPGYDIIYPANASGDFYKIFMGSEEGGKLDPQNMRRKQRDFSLSGSYRKMLARIEEDYTVEAKAYANENEQFVQTDMERLNAKPADDTEAKQEGGAHDEAGKDKIAIVLKFQLGSSQYATMALRELSKGGVQAHKPDFNGGR